MTDERRARVLQLIRSKGEASVDHLSREIGVSAATVRRDLRALVDSGELVRTYGGAVPSPARPVAGRATERADVKRRIGRRAAQLIQEGETVAIGSGTTALEVARQLMDRGSLTVVSNALDVLQLLLDRPGIELVALGGVVRPGMHSLLGHLTELTAGEMQAGKLVMGTAAFDPERGLSNDHMPEVLTDRALRAMAREVIVVADSSKFGRIAPARLFGLEEVDTLVTDDGLPSAGRTAIERLGVRVVTA